MKLSAFTLLELLIGMIISSIIITIGYSSYSIINKQFSSYKLYRTELVEIANLNSEIEKEFSDSEFVLRNQNQLTFKHKDSREVKFEFNEHFILRNEMQAIDTFWVNNKNYTFGFLDNSEIFVSTFSFNSNLIGEDVFLNFEKKYSSDILIKNDLNKSAEWLK